MPIKPKWKSAKEDIVIVLKKTRKPMTVQELYDVLAPKYNIRSIRMAVLSMEHGKELEFNRNFRCYLIYG